MRLKWWALFVVLLSALVTLSCRKTVAPNTDRNRAPETYLTASPLDSIGGGSLNRVPYRFHAHWSGADIDGQVVGYYIAVTETLPGARIPLPPPKPQQWRFTTRTDSVFIFNIHEGRGSDREHGLYVFAVDNEGKTDATPAFTRFVARDRNLPGITWITHRAEGTIYLPDAGGGVREVVYTRELTDPEDPVGATYLPTDTIPAGAAVFFEWVGFDRDWASQILGYRYKLYEPDYVRTDPTGTSMQYGTGVGPGAAELPIGLNVFRVQSVDEAGGTTDPDSLRRFVVNFDPDTWWFGPDTTDAALQAVLQRDASGLYVVSPDGTTPPELGKWLGPQRFDVLPAERRSEVAVVGMRTFIEKVRYPTEYRFYVHTDFDTVSRNADQVFVLAGGSDKDSPYFVSIQASNPPGHRVGTPGPPNGSPIGCEYRIVRVDAITGSPKIPVYSILYPNFDPLSAGFNPEVYYSSPEDFTGTSYAQARSVDGNVSSSSGRDRRFNRRPHEYMLRYDACVQNPVGCELTEAEMSLRPLVMVWHVNKNPYFLTDIAGFAPTADTLVTASPFTAVLHMHDPDSTTGGSDRAPFLMRARVLTLEEGTGVKPIGRNENWQPANAILMRSGDTLPIIIEDDLPPGRNFFEFELSDFPNELDLNDRRIVLVKFPFYWLTRP